MTTTIKSTHIKEIQPDFFIEEILKNSPEDVEKKAERFIKRNLGIEE